MNEEILSFEAISKVVKPLAEKYKAEEVYLFGSYARGEADKDSDLDFLVFGGEDFELTDILAMGEDLREILKKKVDIFEICEINKGTDFYNNIMREKVLVA